MYSTRASREMRATPAQVYRALVDGDLIERWRVPDGMTGQVHELDAHEGGRFRVSLTYDRGAEAGKSSAHTDTYRGRFLRLVENEMVVEVLEFKTDDPALGGEMTMTTAITQTAEGASVVMVHDGVPDAVRRADNQAGMEMALARLAALVEVDSPGDS
ncbi:MAG TPA: SRPBCC domain-containing protein [Nocardioidaceae bacterium]|nr:SRPBCC domain-containing protein [Nocardioidaceae bacterium]